MVPKLQLKKENAPIDHDFDIIDDNDMEGFEGLMYPESKLLKGKEMATRRQNNGGGGATDRFDIDKYINSDFELVAETSLHPFAVPTQPALL